jgi:hypothetical protein
MRKTISAAALGSILALGACGSSGNEPKASAASAATPTTLTKDAFCQQLKQTGDSFGDPGIDAIFKDNPNPTLAQWAAFLPAPIARMRSFITQLKAIPAPTNDLAGKQQAVVDSFTAVADALDDSLSAAKTGDQAMFSAAESKNQDEATPKLQSSFEALGGACGFKS